MILLNTDYEDLYRQLKDIENSFLDCTNPNTSAVYYGTYQTLAQFYVFATGENPWNSRINHNKYVLYSGSQRLNSLGKKRVEEFIQKQKEHLSFVSSTFFDFSDFFNDFVDSLDYYNIYTTREFEISEAEGREILYSFFEKYNPKMRDLFDSFLDRDKFYMIPDSNLYSYQDGCTFYNPVENDCDVFLQPKIRSLRLLSLIIHELSHVDDAFSYAHQTSPVNVSLYHMRSPFCEVPSYYYQLSFYDFLIKNNIYKENAVVEVVTEMNNAIQSMDNLLLLSLYPSKKLRKQSAFLSKREVFDSVLESQGKDCPIEFDENFASGCDGMEVSNEMISLDDALQYSYGPLLGLAMLGDDELYRKFSMIRDSYFDSQKLSSIGLGEEEVLEKVMKKSNGLLGRNL